MPHPRRSGHRDGNRVLVKTSFPIAHAQVSPEATWASKQHRVRWVLPEIAAGDRGDLQAQFLPDTKSDPLASAGVLEGAAGLSCSVTRSRRLLVSFGHGCGERAAGPSWLREHTGLERCFLHTETTSTNRLHQDLKLVQAFPVAAAVG